MPVLNRPKILIVEDEKSIQETLKMVLEDLYWVVAVASAEEALPLLEREAFSLALIDIHLPGLNGEELLGSIKTSWPATEVVMVTGVKDVDQAVRCMKQGAYDFISKPWKVPELQAVVNRAAEKWALTQENNLLRQSQEMSGEAQILGSSDAVKLLRERVQKVAAHDSTVLIEGESGTGKELVAKSIHTQSSRRKGRFVAIACGALPANLVESELFGHEKGAFSSAFTSRVGKFEFASGGTIFLDDVAALPMESQAKLLRVLQEREVTRLGSNRVIPVDVRVLSSSNLDLKDLVKRNLFREDLYWRLCGVPIQVPPLRERGDDAAELFEIFVARISASYKRKVPRISPAALQSIKHHPFPGNIRELMHLAETMVVLCEDDEIAVSSLPIKLIMLPMEQGVAQSPLKKSVHEFERQLILRTLRSVNHHQIRTAEALGIHRNTLILKMIEYGIPNKKTLKSS
jgi:DNA-binding NtrC family response regulator